MLFFDDDGFVTYYRVKHFYIARALFPRSVNLTLRPNLETYTICSSSLIYSYDN